MPLARISLTLSRLFSLSFIASGRSSGLHPVSSHSCWMYVRAGRPAFARPYVGIHRSTSLMSSSLLLQQCPTCLVRLTWIVFVMGGRWPYSWCLVGCCRQDLFNIARNILVWLPSSFFSSRLVSVQVVHLYSSIDTTTAWKKLRFILSVRCDFHMIDNLSIAVHVFVSRVSMSFSVDGHRHAANGGIDGGVRRVQYLSRGYLFESERNRATGVPVRPQSSSLPRTSQ